MVEIYNNYDKCRFLRADKYGTVEIVFIPLQSCPLFEMTLLPANPSSYTHTHSTMVMAVSKETLCSSKQKSPWQHLYL